MNGNVSFFKIFTRTGDKLLENCDFIIGHGTSFLKLSVAQIKLMIFENYIKLGMILLYVSIVNNDYLKVFI